MSLPRVTARYEADGRSAWGHTEPEVSFVIEFDHNDTDEALRLIGIAFANLSAQIERSRPKENA